MQYTSVCELIEGAARHLCVVYENVITSRKLCVNLQSLQQICHPLHILSEGFIGIDCTRYIRKLDTACVGIDTAATAFPSENINLVFFAVVGVYLIVN